MYPTLNLPIAIPWIVSLILMSGCDEQAVQIAREAAERQAQQNTAMADLNKEVAGGTRRLVEADAQARKQIVGVHRDLQAERKRLDTSWNSLDAERRQIADERRTESLLVPAIQTAGLVVLVALVLGLSWYGLVRSNTGNAETELKDLLISEMLADEPRLLSDNQERPALIDRSKEFDPLVD